MTVSVPLLIGTADAEAAPDDAPVTAEGAVPDEDADAVVDAVDLAFEVQAARAAEPATTPAPLRKERLLTCV
jgi:hypothetical protein